MIKYPGPLARASVLKVPGGVSLNTLKTINSPGDLDFQSRGLLYLKFFGHPATFAKADAEPPISISPDAWDVPKAFIEEGLFRVIGRYDLYVAWRELRGMVPGTVNPSAGQIAVGANHVVEDSSNLDDTLGDPTEGWQQYDSGDGARYYTRREAYVRTHNRNVLPSANGNLVRAACIVDRQELGQFLIVCCFVDEATDEFHYLDFKDIADPVWEPAGTVNYPSVDAGISPNDPRPGRASFNASGTKMVTACSPPTPFSKIKVVPLKVVLATISHDIQDNTPDPPTASFSVTAALDTTHTFFLTEVIDDLTTTTTTGDDIEGTQTTISSDSNIRTYKLLCDVAFYVDSLEYIWLEGDQTITFSSNGVLEWFDPEGEVDNTFFGSSSSSKITNFKLFSSLWEKHEKLVNSYAGSPDDGTEGLLLDKAFQESSTDNTYSEVTEGQQISTKVGDFVCSLFTAPCIEYACARTGVVVVDYSFYRADILEENVNVTATHYDQKFTYTDGVNNHIKRFISRPTPPNYIPKQTKNSDKIAVPITSEVVSDISSIDVLLPVDDLVNVVIPASVSTSNRVRSDTPPNPPNPVVPGVVSTPNQQTNQDGDARNMITNTITRKTTLDLNARFRNFKTHPSSSILTELGFDNSAYLADKLEDDWAKGYEPVYCADDVYGNVISVFKHGTLERIFGGSLARWDSTSTQRLFVNGVEQTDVFLDPYLIDREYILLEPSGSGGALDGELISFISNPVGFLHSLYRYC